MKKPELFLQVKKFLEDYDVGDNPEFTVNFLLKKIAEEEQKAADAFAKDGDVAAIKDHAVNLIFLMTSLSCLMDINPLEEITKRIEEVKKGYHPFLDEFLKQTNK